MILLLLLACTDPVPDALLDLQSANPMVKQDALVGARTLKDERITAVLADIAADTDPRLRLEAVRALDEHGAVEPLIARLGDDDPDVRKLAIDALGRAADPAATEALIALLQEPDPPLNAIWALGEVGSPDALPALSALRTHPDKWVRYNTDEALRKIE